MLSMPLKFDLKRIGMDTLLQDLRYALRILKKNPGFSGVAIITLALGIGANTAIFSVVNAVLLRSLPYAEPDRLVMVWEKRPNEGRFKGNVAPADFFDWRERNQTFEGIAALTESTVELSGKGDPERVSAGEVSSSFFEVLGVRPAFGRTFSIEHEQAGRHRVAIISDGLWQRRFGSDRELVGKTILLNDEQFEVIGILQPGFRFPGEEIQLWRPMVSNSQEMRSRVRHFLTVYARLKEGTTLEQSTVEMDRIGSELAQEFPNSNSTHGAHVVSLKESLVGEVSGAMLILLGAVSLLLLIACANVANLLLARSAAREKEIALRSALGARRIRIVRQLLTESMLLSIVGGTLGVLLALWGVELLAHQVPSEVPRLHDLTPDVPVLLYTLGVSVFTGLLFGSAPAFQLSRARFGEALKEGARGSRAGQRIRNYLVISEVSLALVLLIGAGLLMRSFVALQKVEPGFRYENVMTAQLSLPRTRYRDNQQIKTFVNQLLQRVRELPAIDSAAVTWLLPMSSGDARTGIEVEGREAPEGEPTRAHFRSVSAGYFETMGIDLLEGRVLNDRDVEGSPLVTLVNRRAAELYWPGSSPIGRRLRIAGSEQWREIVGVVGDVKYWGLEKAVNPEMYFPNNQYPVSSMTLVVRSSSDQGTLMGAVRAQARELDEQLPLSNVRSMEEVLSASTTSFRFYMLLFGAFAIVATGLAAAGIYSVLSYSVTQRTREMGIRMALGAKQVDLIKMVVGQGMVTALTGILLGAGGSLLVTHLISKLLFGVTHRDLVTFLAVPVLLMSVAVLACYLPARRAAKVEPMEALRYE
jgi:putative ABC transport system permease protein